MLPALSAPSLEEIRAAQSRLQGAAVRTPLIKLNYDMAGIEIYLKCEQCQPISSFKIRGATNAVRMLSFEEKQHGIVTASAGNMAQGLAWIAREEQIPCRVLVPDTANEVKLQAIERLQGQVTKCTFDQWWQVIVTHHCPMIEGHFIHPVCNRHVMAGNGTIALEILEDLPDCDAILGDCLGFNPRTHDAFLLQCPMVAVHWSPASPRPRNISDHRLMSWHAKSRAPHRWLPRSSTMQSRRFQ